MREAKAADAWIWGGGSVSQRAGIVSPGDHDALQRMRHGVAANPLVIERNQNRHSPPGNGAMLRTHRSR